MEVSSGLCKAKVSMPSWFIILLKVKILNPQSCKCNNESVPAQIAPWVKMSKRRTLLLRQN